ncbi:MAG: cupredoxin domain-containing protein [Nitrosotalea sp.]
MKILHLSIIIGAGITAAIGIFIFLTFPSENKSNEIVPPPAPSPQITTVIILPGSEDQNSGKTYDPPSITVMMGINSTVQWINKADVPNSIVSDGIGDAPESAIVMHSSSIMPGQSYEFIFTVPGTYHYHGEPHPWQKGTVIVLSRQ